jgi:predicted RNA-binding protein with PUA-like domain
MTKAPTSKTKTAAKKPAAQSAAKSATTAKSATKKVAVKKPAAKKTPAKKSPAKKAVARKPAAKKAPAAPATIERPAFWLFKSEPNVFSFDDLKKKGKKGEEWDGVRNYLARNNMRSMEIGELGFFYHSNIGLEVVGICEVCKLAHPDSTTDDERWECVDVRYVCALPKPVSLVDVKANPKLEKMSLVTSMRLSVQPVLADEWAEVCRMGGLDPKKIR